MTILENPESLLEHKLYENVVKFHIPALSLLARLKIHSCRSVTKTESEIVCIGYPKVPFHDVFKFIAEV
jgi:hypothetical protein